MEENQTPAKPNGESKRTLSPLANGLKLPKFKPAKPGEKRRYPLDLKQALAARAKAGESIPDLSKATGIHSTQIKRWANGEGMLPAGGKGSRKKRKPKPEPVLAATPRKAGRENQVIRDALYYLGRAEKWAYQALRDGEIDKFDQAHDWSRQALRELEKLK